MDDLWVLLGIAYMIYRVLERLRMLHSIGRLLLGIVGIFKVLLTGIEKILLFLTVPKSEQGKEKSLSEQLAEWAERVTKVREGVGEETAGAQGCVISAEEERLLAALEQEERQKREAEQEVQTATTDTASLAVRTDLHSLQQAVVWSEILAPSKARRMLRRR